MFIEKGQTIKLNRRVEIEMEDGEIAVIEAGEEMTVNAINAINADGSLQIEISAADVPLINPWDRSGCSDTEITVRAHTMDISADDIEP